MTGRPRLLVVGAGLFQLELLRAARRVAEVVAVDGAVGAPGLALADHPHVLDVRDLTAVVELARRLRVDGVVTAASDVAVPAVSAVVDALGVPGLPSAVSARCRDKQAAFEAGRDAGLSVPESRAVRDVASARRAAADLGGFPIVIKPRSGGGGRGVSVVRDPEELDGAVRRARTAYTELGANGVLVQQCIGGHSLGAEAVFVDGRLRDCFVFDDQYASDYVSPIGHSLPAAIDAATREGVLSAVQAFGSALGLTSGAVNYDLRQVEDRVVPIEVNPRLGGNSITALVQHATGADLAAAAVACALGRDPGQALQRTRAEPVAVRLIMRRGHGIARVAPHVEALRQAEGVIALDLTVRDGEPTAVHVDDFCLLGRCVVRGESGAAAAQAAAELARRVAGAVRIAQAGRDEGTPR